MTYTAKIDKQSCLSSGRCVAAAPEGFGLDEDRLGHVLPGAVALERERLIEVARRCPGLAISILDEDRNEIPP